MRIWVLFVEACASIKRHYFSLLAASTFIALKWIKVRRSEKWNIFEGAAWAHAYTILYLVARRTFIRYFCKPFKWVLLLSMGCFLFTFFNEDKNCKTDLSFLAFKKRETRLPTFSIEVNGPLPRKSWHQTSCEVSSLG